MVLEDRSKLDVSTDELGDLQQRVSPVEDLLDRHPPVAEALGVEEVVLVKADAHCGPDVLALGREVDGGKQLRLEVLIRRAGDHQRDEVVDDLLLEEFVGAILPGVRELGEVGVVEERHLCWAKVSCCLEGVAGRWLQICLAETVLSIW